jgi:pimeloyl-ACP methyl ester carboxylesterase
VKRTGTDTNGLLTAGGHYAAVNGLNMYYEVHGSGRPLVLLHGSFSAIDSSFGAILPGLANGRQIIAVEMQGHGRTADIDRSLTIEDLARDVVALIRLLGFESVDLLGYSLGAGVALQVAIDSPDLVRKLVIMSLSIAKDGLVPGVAESLDMLQPDDLAGTPWHREYARLAPQPEAFPVLVEKVKELNRNISDWSPQAVQSIEAPTLIIVGDSDIIRPEHAVEVFRLLGGGGSADPMAPPAKVQLAVLPGTRHEQMVARPALINSIVPAFLDSD